MDFRLLVHIYRKEIIRVLSYVNGSKVLFIDEALIKRIDIIISASGVKEHNVIKISKLGSPVQNSCSRFLYIIKSDLKSLTKVIDQFTSDRKDSVERIYNIFFVPQITFECEELLARNGLIGEVEFGPLFIGLIPLAKDVLSLGIPDFYHSAFADNVWLLLAAVARSLNVLQRCFGRISQIHSFGQISGNVGNMIENTEEPPGMISHLLLIDRTVDLITPFTTNITYGGILTEVFGLREDAITLPKGQSDLIPGRFSLSNPDKILEEFCDLHFSNVTFELTQKVKKMSSNMGKLSSTSLEELRKFVVSDLSAIREDQRQLVQHLSACEHIQRVVPEPNLLFSTEHTTIQDADRTAVVEYVLDLVYRNMDEYLALALVVLLSQSTGVIWKSEIEQIIRAFCHSFGYHYLSTFDELVRAGLISVNTSGNVFMTRLASNIVKPTCHFRTMAKKLNLLPPQKTIEKQLWKDMSDVSYLFNGCYIPAVYRLTEEFLDSLMNEKSSLYSLASDCNLEYKSSIRERGPKSPSCVMVFVLGGCTMQEIAAIRFLERKRGVNIIVGCTSIVNKYDILKPFVTSD